VAWCKDRLAPVEKKEEQVKRDNLIQSVLRKATQKNRMQVLPLFMLFSERLSAW